MTTHHVTHTPGLKMTTPVFEKDHNIRLETDLTFTKESKCDNFVAHKIILHFPFYPKFTPSFTLTQIIFTQILPNLVDNFKIITWSYLRCLPGIFKITSNLVPVFYPYPNYFLPKYYPFLTYLI